MDSDIRKLLRIAKSGGLVGLAAQDLYDLRDLINAEIDRQVRAPCTLEVWESFTLPSPAQFVPPSLTVYVKAPIRIFGHTSQRPGILLGDKKAYSGLTTNAPEVLELKPWTTPEGVNVWVVVSCSPGWWWKENYYAQEGDPALPSETRA